MLHRLISLSVLLLLARGVLAQSPMVALPEGVQAPPVWGAEEQARDIAVRPLQRSEFASTHLIRLRGSEQPHFHDRHDLAITLLSGASVLHFADRDIALRAGDTAFIPRGSYHWAENTGTDASVVFAVFAPPFDGKDRRPATQTTP